MEEDSSIPVVESAWFDSQPDIDEDYGLFLQHLRRKVDDKLMFTMGNCSITIGEGSVDHSDAEDDDDTEEEEEWDEEEEDDDEKEEGEEDAEVDSPSPGQLGEDGIGAEEKDDEEEAISASVTEDGVGSDLPIPKLKEEDVDDDDVGPESDVQIVDDPVDYETEVEGAEKPLNAPVRGTTDLDHLGKKEASSSKEHLAMPLNASELQGVIWPPHINERPDSVFKEKLIEILIKPFTKEAYDKYFAMATGRSPMLKERRTRNREVSYSWTHELNESYFDRYPDLTEQFSLQCNNYPNRLALLRGIFFWLQNIMLEGQFRPWSDEFKKYRVVTLME